MTSRQTILAAAGLTTGWDFTSFDDFTTGASPGSHNVGQAVAILCDSSFDPTTATNFDLGNGTAATGCLTDIEAAELTNTGYARVDVTSQVDCINESGNCYIGTGNIVFGSIQNDGATPKWCIIAMVVNGSDITGTGLDFFILCAMDIGSTAPNGTAYTVHPQLFSNNSIPGWAEVYLTPAGDVGGFDDGIVEIFSGGLQKTCPVAKVKQFVLVTDAYTHTTGTMAEVEDAEVSVSGYARFTFTTNDTDSSDPEDLKIGTTDAVDHTLYPNVCAYWTVMGAGELINGVVIVFNDQPISYHPFPAPVRTEHGLLLGWDDDGSCDNKVWELTRT